MDNSTLEMDLVISSFTSPMASVTLREMKICEIAHVTTMLIKEIIMFCSINLQITRRHLVRGQNAVGVAGLEKHLRPGHRHKNSGRRKVRPHRPNRIIRENSLV